MLTTCKLGVRIPKASEDTSTTFGFIDAPVVRCWHFSDSRDVRLVSGMRTKRTSVDASEFMGFRACAPCHSLEPDRNMTGPSLANLWGHKAGSLPSFDRYSDALKSSGIIWDDRALDGWLTDPQRMVPDNEMPFEGINDALVRADLLAFLKDATKSPCIVGNSIRLASEVESGDALG
jgi:cytochrome c2